MRTSLRRCLWRLAGCSRRLRRGCWLRTVARGWLWRARGRWRSRWTSARRSQRRRWRARAGSRTSTWRRRSNRWSVSGRLRRLCHRRWSRGVRTWCRSGGWSGGWCSRWSGRWCRRWAALANNLLALARLAVGGTAASRKVGHAEHPAALSWARRVRARALVGARWRVVFAVIFAVTDDRARLFWVRLASLRLAHAERALAFRLFQVATSGAADGLEVLGLVLQQVARRRVGVHVKDHVLVHQHALVRWQQRHLTEPRTESALAITNQLSWHLHAVHDCWDVVARGQPARSTGAHHDHHLVVLDHWAHVLTSASLDHEARGIVRQLAFLELTVGRHIEELWRHHGNEQAVVFVQVERQLEFAVALASHRRRFVRVEVVETHGLAHELARRDGLVAVRSREVGLVERHAEVVDGAFHDGAELLVELLVAWALVARVGGRVGQFLASVGADGVAVGAVLERLLGEERGVWVLRRGGRALSCLSEVRVARLLKVWHVAERHNAIGLERIEHACWDVRRRLHSGVVERRDVERAQLIVRLQRSSRGRRRGQTHEHLRNADHDDRGEKERERANERTGGKRRPSEGGGGLATDTTAGSYVTRSSGRGQWPIHQYLAAHNL
ncbi:TPA: hypothetical protein N0F65_001184 [Lagenidium giganteum]|uniref:Uncharacterized protein n=1 Tax=Lagenidium giganteum TaxID=4803 RepID=A0AAV2Z179_9STRA|nr:TPA: hypothetical protein N0F65_001184 [Lagenidium giganteum]